METKSTVYSEIPHQGYGYTFTFSCRREASVERVEELRQGLVALGIKLGPTTYEVQSTTEQEVLKKPRTTIVLFFQHPDSSQATEVLQATAPWAADGTVHMVKNQIQEIRIFLKIPKEGHHVEVM